MKLRYTLVGVGILLLLLMIFLTTLILNPEWYPIFPKLSGKVVTLSTIMAAWATVILAIAAFCAIWHSNEQEKHRRVEALLREIITWAIDIARCETEAEFRSSTRKSMLVGLLLKYQALDARGAYIKVITLKNFSGRLQVAVSETAKKLNEHLGVLKMQIEGKTTAEERDKHWLSLYKTSLNLTKQVAEFM